MQHVVLINIYSVSTFTNVKLWGWAQYSRWPAGDGVEFLCPCTPLAHISVYKAIVYCALSQAGTVKHASKLLPSIDSTRWYVRTAPRWSRDSDALARLCSFAFSYDRSATVMLIRWACELQAWHHIVVWSVSHGLTHVCRVTLWRSWRQGNKQLLAPVYDVISSPHFSSVYWFDPFKQLHDRIWGRIGTWMEKD